MINNRFEIINGVAVFESSVNKPKIGFCWPEFLPCFEVKIIQYLSSPFVGFPDSSFLYIFLIISFWLVVACSLNSVLTLSTLLSTLKTNNKAINVVGSIYAKENKLHNCLLLNTNKHVIEALNGNVFVVNGNVIKTPPIADGCLKGIMRKQLTDILKKLPEYKLIEDSISPFELQKADEVFITNVIVGIQPVTKYRKKTFKKEVSKMLLQKLNVKIRLN